MAGRHDEGLRAARTLLAQPMSHRDGLYWSAVNLRSLGRVKEALETLDALERAHPNSGLLFEERGLCQLALGEDARALRCFERSVAINPALKPSWAALERLLTAAGAPDRASAAAQQLATLERLPPAIVEAAARFCDGDDVIAERQLVEFISSEGRHVEALRLLGRIAQRRGALTRAERLLREAVDCAPFYAEVRLDLARVLIALQNYEAALAQVDERLNHAPADPQARFLRATILAGLGRHEEAAPILRELIAEAPQQNHLRIVLGHSLKALGRAEAAVRAYREASAGVVHVGDAWWSLANLKSYKFDDAEIRQMRRLEARAPAGPPDREQLCFALGKALEDRGEYAASWAYYARGNALVRARSHYRPEAVEEEARRLMEVFNPDFLAARAGAGAPARDPIFIVGLPRSGSTLLEQILASHADVDGTQELQELPRLVAELREDGSTEEGYPNALRRMEAGAFRRMGMRYLDETSAYRRGRPRFIDKMPNNFWRIGLIHLMLPNAKIIDMRRHPMATCVSNLKQYYAKGQDFCYDVKDVARYYIAYVALMRHWSEALPGRVLQVDYENLVEDFEAVVRRILSHCELDFDPACLEFHRNRRAVNTPSSEQVRQPLFRDGLSGWSRFEPWLAPLRAALEEALVDFH